MVYSDAGKVSITSDGDLHIKTDFGNIVDHAPVTFYEGNKDAVIKSKFLREGKIISIQLENYDKTKKVIVDPWTQTPTLNNSNGVWECKLKVPTGIANITFDTATNLIHEWKINEN